MGSQSKAKNMMANSVDPDETAHCEPSHLDLHCLQRYMKGLNQKRSFWIKHFTVIQEINICFNKRPFTSINE